MKTKLIILLQWECHYEADKSLYKNLVKEGKWKFEDYASITRELGSVISCTIVYTEDIQNTVSISNNDRIKSYHKSLKYSMVILLIQVNLKNQCLLYMIIIYIL